MLRILQAACLSFSLSTGGPLRRQSSIYPLTTFTVQSRIAAFKSFKSFWYLSF